MAEAVQRFRHIEPKEATTMESRCNWFCNLEDVKDHQPDSVLWCRQGYEHGPLIFPAGYIPTGPFTRMGTIESLSKAMQQALATDTSLHQSLRRCDAIAIHAKVSEQGASYSFHPARASNDFSM
jgi:hypothetical protein